MPHSVNPLLRQNPTNYITPSLFRRVSDNSPTFLLFCAVDLIAITFNTTPFLKPIGLASVLL
jgi:hypothetical protein